MLPLDNAMMRLLAAATTRGEEYILFVENYQASIAAILRSLAAAPDGGVLYHCQAGKDRTGIITALLLGLAGVPEEVIIADYAASQALLRPQWSARWQRRWQPSGAAFRAHHRARDHAHAAGPLAEPLRRTRGLHASDRCTIQRSSRPFATAAALARHTRERRSPWDCDASSASSGTARRGWRRRQADAPPMLGACWSGGRTVSDRPSRSRQTALPPRATLAVPGHGRTVSDRPTGASSGIRTVGDRPSEQAGPAAQGHARGSGHGRTVSDRPTGAPRRNQDGRRPSFQRSGRVLPPNVTLAIQGHGPTVSDRPSRGQARSLPRPGARSRSVVADGRSLTVRRALLEDQDGRRPSFRRAGTPCQVGGILVVQGVADGRSLTVRGGTPGPIRTVSDRPSPARARALACRQDAPRNPGSRTDGLDRPRALSAEPGRSETVLPEERRTLPPRDTLAVPAHADGRSPTVLPGNKGACLVASIRRLFEHHAMLQTNASHS